MKKESTKKSAVKKTDKTKKVEKKNVSKNTKTNTKVVANKKKSFNIFKAIGNWFKEEYLELKRVSWPTKREVFKNFIATVLCVVFLGILFYVIDIVMVWLKTVVM